MKIRLKYFVVITFVGFIYTGCDQFENVFLNLPINKEITATGNGPDIFERETICFSDYDSFNDNADDIEAVSYTHLTLPTSDIV